MNKYFGKVMDDKIIFNREAFFKLIEETKEEGIEEGYRIALETLYGDGFDEAGEFLDNLRKKKR